MRSLEIKDRRSTQLAAFILGALALAWVWALGFVTEEANQGQVYRILYVHVPCAFAAFFSAFYLFCASLSQIYVRRLSSSRFPFSAESLAQHGQASAEVGLLFTVSTLLTGALWGKPTWGTWWTWDARLTKKPAQASSSTPIA